LNAIRYAALTGLLATAMLCGAAAESRAAATVSKFSLVVSGMPTQIQGGDFNDYVDFFNRTELAPRGYVDLEKISFGWLFDARAQYFLTQDVAVTFGAGTMQAKTRREFLPALQQTIELRGEIETVPIHAGALFYMAPYNQGDFQARAYVGGGVMHLVANRVELLLNQINTDSVTTVVPSTAPPKALGDGPGWYGEFGVHMFFASRFSAMIGAVYRSAEIKGMLDRDSDLSGAPRQESDVDGLPFDVDLSGFALRMGVGIGF
jgi:hypothetical protein